MSSGNTHKSRASFRHTDSTNLSHNSRQKYRERPPFFLHTINPRKQYPPADLGEKKQQTKRKTLSCKHPNPSEWEAVICGSHPSTDNTQSQLPGGGNIKINKRWQPHTWLHLFHRNSNHWMLLPAPANLTAGYRLGTAHRHTHSHTLGGGQESKTGSKREQTERLQKVETYLSQRRPEYPGGQLSHVGWPSEST